MQGAQPTAHPGTAAQRSSRPAVEVSVVMPCLNVADVLPHQLDALAAQQFGRTWEVVIVDNGSTDGTRDVALAYADRLPGLRVVDASARRGRHHACNVGVRAATGAYVVFADADDEITPGYVAAMARALATNPVVAARLDHGLDAEWMQGVGSAVQTAGLQDGFGFLPFGAGCSLGFRRDVFDAIGGFREEATLCEDVDISWRAQLAGYPIAFVPDAVVRYRSRPTLRGMYRQHRDYARARPFLYREFRGSGMPRSTVGSAAREWWALLRALPRLRSRDQFARWTRRAGRCVGRLEGSARYRVWYP